MMDAARWLSARKLRLSFSYRTSNLRKRLNQLCATSTTQRRAFFFLITFELAGLLPAPLDMRDVATLLNDLQCGSAGVACVGTQVLVSSLRRVGSFDHDGNQWYFGMKAHIGVDADSGLVHMMPASFLYHVTSVMTELRMESWRWRAFVVLISIRSCKELHHEDGLPPLMKTRRTVAVALNPAYGRPTAARGRFLLRVTTTSSLWPVTGTMKPISQPATPQTQCQTRGMVTTSATGCSMVHRRSWARVWIASCIVSTL